LSWAAIVDVGGKFVMTETAKQLSDMQILLNSLSKRSPSDVRRKHIDDQLRVAGLSWWGFLTSEMKVLPTLLFEDEMIHGVLCGQSSVGYVALVATDRRILFVDKKPLYLKTEDVPYSTINSITFEWVGFKGIVELHTRVGDYRIRTINRRAADVFHEYIRGRSVDQMVEVQK
jgi:hypothetical protein